MNVSSDPIVYFPLSDQLISDVLRAPGSLAEKISRLGVPQIAALIVIQQLTTEGRLPPPQQMLSQMIDLGNQSVTREGAQAFAAQAFRALNPEKLARGYELLETFNIALLDHNELGFRNYLTAERGWNSDFSKRRSEQLRRFAHRIELPNGESRILTTEQSRVYWEIKGQHDDHAHLQGYAGTGKSTLIKCVANMLASQHANVLLLAERQDQLDALLGGLKGMDRVFPRTFGQLMFEIIPADRTNPGHMRMRQVNENKAATDDSQLADMLGVHSVGDLSRLQIVQAAHNAVRAYCRSNDRHISHHHIPTDFRYREAAIKQLILHHASGLWQAIISPAPQSVALPIRSYHRIKWAALNRLQIPRRYTHVLIDECHDISSSVLQVIENSSQATISLGDEYQNLQGRPQYRVPTARHREVTNSVRSGIAVEEMLNAIIDRHPGKTKLPFRGNRSAKIQLHYYRRHAIPAEPTAILAGDELGLLEWAQWLSASNVKFGLLGDLDRLNMFVNDLIDLKLNEVRPRHGALFRCHTWRDVEEKYYYHSGFRRVERMLRDGYGFDDWSNTVSHLSTATKGQYVLAQIGDVRNQEFDSVMLSLEVVEWAQSVRRTAHSKALSAMYVAITRARNQLFLPQKFQDWIQDI